MLRILAILGVAAAVSLATPAFAAPPTQDQVDAAKAAIEEADLSDDAYKDLWCGGQFGIVQSKLTADGKTDDAVNVGKIMEALYTKAVTAIDDPEMTQESITALATNFVIVASVEDNTTAEFTQEECEAAAK
jgi:hypothetical protein